jgi:predicted glycosyltransferase
MKLLIDLNHPAHVHLFRHAIHAWQQDGHQVIITARDKEVTTRLLDLYGISYTLTTRPFILWQAKLGNSSVKTISFINLLFATALN